MKRFILFMMALRVSTNGDYWLQGGDKSLHSDNENTSSIADADTGGTTTAAIRLVKTN